MNPQLIVSVLSSIAALLGNPALGILSGWKIQSLMDLVSGLILRGAEAVAELQALDSQLKLIVSEGRPPTTEEWDEWDARHQSAKARIANA